MTSPSVGQPSAPTHVGGSSSPEGQRYACRWWTSGWPGWGVDVVVPEEVPRALDLHVVGVGERLDEVHVTLFPDGEHLVHPDDDATKAPDVPGDHDLLGLDRNPQGVRHDEPDLPEVVQVVRMDSEVRVSPSGAVPGD